MIRKPLSALAGPFALNIFFMNIFFMSTFLISNAMALPDHHPVPGGIAVIPIGIQEPARYNGTSVITITENDGAYAIIGLPLQSKPGEHELVVGQRRIAFTIESFEYETETLTITNRRQVNPLQEDMVRINRERKAMNMAFANFDISTIPELNFRTPTMGRQSSSFGVTPDLKR